MSARPTPGPTVAIGADFGKVTTCLAWAEVRPDGKLGVPQTRAERHRGEPLRAFLELYRELGAEHIAGIVATGAHGERLAAPAQGGLPEEVAQERAARALLGDRTPFTVVRIGGSGYSVLTRDAQGLLCYETNERCSAGTGETVEGLCGRLGRDLDEAVRLAEASPDGLVVTSRCAVFAKSELTHYANQGEDHGRLFRGLFESVARNVHGLYDKLRVEGPVLLIGHGALLGPVAGAFRELAGPAVQVPAEAAVFEALGALAVAAGQARHGAWPADPEALVAPLQRRVRALEAASEGPGTVARLEAGPSTARRDEPAVLGLDLGSTGSKAALLGLESRALLADVYRRTDGNPVEAAQALVAEIAEMALNPVVAVGLTGSGRDAAAIVVRAAFPGLGERLVVENEIVAHAVAARSLDPDGGRSLSIVEIGGQDAKFINLQDGRVLESDMNRVCSAGTGSFLEEQSLAHGIDDIVRFGELAARARRPPDLGQTCTVFVADVAAEALAEGFTREDIFAGLQYSVIRNYRHRVMGNRRFGERIFFQGKPAASPSLARTLAAVTGREVWVPPNPGAMGAIGIAMLAAERLQDGRGEGLDLARVVGAAVTGRREFRCRDAHCQNLCRIEAAKVVVGHEETTVVSGGSCPKYDEAGAGGRKLPRDVPQPFREREELLARLVSGEAAAADGLTTAESGEAAAADGPSTAESGRGAGEKPLADLTVGLPYVHYLVDALPFFHAFFERLGADVRVLRPDATALAEGDRRCAAPGACAPVKLLHGLAVDGLDVLLAPTFVTVPYREAGPGCYTCPMAQGAPAMVERALAADGARARVLRPALFRRPEGYDGPGFREELRGLAREAAGIAGRRPPERRVLDEAHAAALERQQAFERGLHDIGRRALAFAREQDVPVLLIAGETHVVHEPLLSCGVAELAAANGAVAVPADCLPVPDAVPPFARIHWASAGRALRTAFAGAAGGDVFPLLVGAYGCGPNSFIEHLFGHLLEGYPHTVLESDGHGGKAGYVTRVQAFLHAVREYRERGVERPAGEGTSGVPGEAAGHVLRRRDDGPAPPPVGESLEASLLARAARFDQPLPHSLDAAGYQKYFFGHVGGTLGRHIAAAMRGRGMDAEYVGPPDQEALHAAQEACSGKECLPYQLIWGTLARKLEEGIAGLNGDKALFLSAGNGFQACRANAFPLTEQLALDRLGLGDRIDVADFSLVTSNVVMMPPVWAALVALDLLNMLRFYHFPMERTRGDADALHQRFSDRLEREMLRPRPDWRTSAAVPEAYRTVVEVETLLREAAAAYRRLPVDRGREADLRDVYLCGDLYLRVDEWGNDDLQRRLADLGLRVLFEPFGEFFELLVLRSIQDEPGVGRKTLRQRATLKGMTYIVDRLVAAVRTDHAWVFWQDIRRVDEAGRAALGAYPFGESIPTVGSALVTWRTQPVDGVVTVAPRGCGPALLAEAELRRAGGFPLLVVYNDGDPLDEARLSGFAWRLRSRPPRRDGAESSAVRARSS